ncbi:NAD(P)-dependent oxidoreductase [Celeribacter persicus]|uniref:Phosphoglycerate dehydrogenase-like enzyme n=1 Tax=Celeribacter persicus TaxID=1651082 RepID=A0A2T5HUU9_9RHOB|nr:NAD(P)-dependent oxidoreductase [Celeribacter persicus]PTQ75362.1 phosphoglycerate dehydrogenase-like enzyme [Celeribacter persicus]
MTQPVIVNQIDPEFGQTLSAHPSQPRVIDHFDRKRPWDLPGDAEVLVTRSFRSWLKAPETCDFPALKWVQTFSAGIETYPNWLMQGRVVTNGRGLTAPQIAEYVMAALLLVEKDIYGARTTSLEDWGTRVFGTLEGKSLGLIGYGAIGAAVAKRARAFDMEVLACRRGAWREVPEGITPCASPKEVLAGSDHAVIAMPLTPETTGMVNDALLAHAKPGLHLINVARGALVEQSALLRALDAGQLSKATLDVTHPEPPVAGDPIWTHPKVLLTPHESYKGGLSERARFEHKMLANLDAWLAGKPMTDVVDLARGY